MISPATRADAAQIGALMDQLGLPMTADEAVLRLARLERTGDDPVFLFRRGDRALGLSALHLSHALNYHGGLLRIMALVVDASARGQGIGQTLVAHADAVARDAGCELVELTSALMRTEAHAFYRGLGFENTSLRFKRAPA